MQLGDAVGSNEPWELFGELGRFRQLTAFVIATRLSSIPYINPLCWRVVIGSLFPHILYAHILIYIPGPSWPSGLYFSPWWPYSPS